MPGPTEIRARGPEHQFNYPAPEPSSGYAEIAKALASFIPVIGEGMSALDLGKSLSQMAHGEGDKTELLLAALGTIPMLGAITDTKNAFNARKAWKVIEGGGEQTASGLKNSTFARNTIREVDEAPQPGQITLIDPKGGPSLSDPAHTTVDVPDWGKFAYIDYYDPSAKQEMVDSYGQEFVDELERVLGLK